MKTTTSYLSTQVFVTLAVLFLSGFMSNSLDAQATEKKLADYLTDLPFAMPKVTEPSFADQSFNIVDYGAIGNGLTLNTEAFAKAIDACSGKGGGKVIVPAGIWLTGPIVFKSNVNLHLEKGALILFSRDHRDYPIIKMPKSSKFSVISPISGSDLENIAITGDGIIDGSGDTWRPVKKAKTTASQWKDLLSSGGVVSADGSMYWPTQEAMDGEAYLKKLSTLKRPLTTKDFEPARDFARPYMVLFQRCNNVLFDGPTLQNSPKFVLYPSDCNNVVIRNTKIFNEWWAQNGDGIDISGGKNIVIYKCLVNAGDDGICMKSSKSKSHDNEPGLQNVVISDCVVYHAHGGFVIGSNIDGGMSNIAVSNCNFISTDVGLRFKSSRGRGGLVENIYVKDIYMKGIATQAILFDTYYESKEAASDVEHTVNEKTPIFQKFHISNIYCIGAEQAVKITGLPEMPIRDIELTNIVISAKKGFTSKDAQNIRMTNATIIPESGVVYSIANSRDMVLKNLTCPAGTGTFLKLDGKTTSNIQLTGTDLSAAKKPVEFGKDVTQNALVRP
jgi:DNA sulfur modification protein DndE